VIAIRSGRSSGDGLLPNSENSSRACTMSTISASVMRPGSSGLSSQRAQLCINRASPANGGLTGLCFAHKKIFPSKTAMTTDDTVATIPGSMKLWFSTYLPMRVVPV
jgi:hypothetical protein